MAEVVPYGTEPRRAPQAVTGLEGLTAVVVDDDPATLRAAGRLLHLLGCEVVPFESPRAALDAIKRGDPADVLITDIVMSEMSGFTLVELAMRVRPDLPVIYISGYAQEEVYWGGTPGVRSLFVQKPLELPELRHAATRLLLGDRKPAPAHCSLHAARERIRPQADAARPATSPPSPVSAPMRRTAAAVGDDQRAGRILVVDDDPAIVGALKRLFRRAGFPEPHGITDPTLARDLVRSGGFDLVILDLHMPEMDGFAVMASLRDVLEPEEYLPILVLTGDDDPALRREALSAGAMDFLNKPFEPSEAEARARNLLATRFLTQRVAHQRDSMEERVMRRTAELADTRAEILHRLARAAEYRDDVTGRHADRVGMLSSQIAGELGMAVRDVDLVRRTAPLHDIGKIGVPDAILNKPGRLSEAEYTLMQSHTTIGAEILGGSAHRILQIASNIALSHHERWDGAGYPHALGETDIPLEARIVAVADTFDVISHRRPYKDALSPTAALEEIVRCAGTHFDPHVVEAFRAITDRVGIEELHRMVDPIDPWSDTTGPEQGAARPVGLPLRIT